MRSPSGTRCRSILQAVLRRSLTGFRRGPLARAAAVSCITVLILLAAGCGGRRARGPGRIPPAPASVTGPSSGARPAPAPAELATIAPEPRIRIGLATSAEAVRLTSSHPFRIGAGRSYLEAHDVLVEIEPSTVVEGFVYRVQLGSFLNESAASSFRERAREEVTDELIVSREAGTGRFAVLAGSFPSAAGARSLQTELRRSGYDAVEVVREPARAPRPRAILLRALGREPVRTEAMALYAVPRRPGAWIEVDGDPYRGFVGITVNASNRLTIVNGVNLEDYLKGVVPAELSPSVFPEKEAIKAQALAARTYAVKRRGEFAAEGYDLCATAACQVYRGVGVEDPLATEAVEETRGEILTYAGEPIDALYTSTCGGRTENAENVFSDSEPYLVSRACFVESRSPVLTAANDQPLALEAAVLGILGIVDEPRREAPVSRAEAERWMSRALAYLGQTPCGEEASASPSVTFDIVALSDLFARALCWERRLPFLMSSLDAARLAPAPELNERERRHLAYAIREGIIEPSPEGIHTGRPLTRETALGAFYGLIASRGEPPLREGTLLSADPGRLRLSDDALGDEANEIATTLAPERYLYQSAAEATYYAPHLVLLPNDRVLFHLGERGVDLLVLLSEGGSFDRSSRFSHWVVRKSNEELTRDVNLRHPVGEIIDLRPRRYGRSGRIVELEVAGAVDSIVLRGLQIRWALGIRENLFFLDAQRSPEGRIESWVFTGRGWGHGVGLCQVGAYGMAAAGYTYRQILSHYYPGTAIEQLSQVQVTEQVDKADGSP